MANDKIPVLNSFTSGTSIVSADVNSNFTNIRDYVNYGIDNTLYAENYNSGSLNSTTLNDAITAAGSDNVTLYIKTGTWTISADVTFPSNIKVVFAKGAILSISSSYTITINGAIDAPTVSYTHLTLPTKRIV